MRDVDCLKYYTLAEEKFIELKGYLSTVVKAR